MTSKHQLITYPFKPHMDNIAARVDNGIYLRLPHRIKYSSVISNPQ